MLTLLCDPLLWRTKWNIPPLNNPQSRQDPCVWSGRSIELVAGTQGFWAFFLSSSEPPLQFLYILFCQMNTTGVEFTYFTLRLWPWGKMTEAWGSQRRYCRGAVGNGWDLDNQKKGGDSLLKWRQLQQRADQEWGQQEWEIVKQKRWGLVGNVFGPDFGALKGKQRSSAWCSRWK